jgi:hypothetical protein
MRAEFQLLGDNCYMISRPCLQPFCYVEGIGRRGRVIVDWLLLSSCISSSVQCFQSEMCAWLRIQNILITVSRQLSIALGGQIQRNLCA